MKKILVAVALASLSATSALAADMAVKAPMYAKAPLTPVPTAYNWTGFYVGANVGYGWSQSDPGLVTFYQPASNPVGSITGLSSKPGGVIGGGQIGYNQQFGNIVLGLEGDYSGADLTDTVTDPVNQYSATTKIGWMATVRGRVGYAFDRTLVYATGGFAAAGVKATLNDFYPSGTITTTNTNTYTGWTLGAGAEWAITSNWSAKIEYLYAGLGSKQNNFYEPSPPGWPRISSNTKINDNVVRVGVNYRFGGPVLARY